MTRADVSREGEIEPKKRPDVITAISAGPAEVNCRDQRGQQGDRRRASAAAVALRAVRPTGNPPASTPNAEINSSRSTPHSRW